MITSLTVVGAVAIGGDSEEKLAQVVTAGVAGELAEVRFPVTCESGNLLVQVVDVDGGVPGDCVYSTTLVDGASLPPFPVDAEFRTIGLTTPVPLEVGTQFAVTLSAAGYCASAQGPVGDSYSGGGGFFDARPNPPGVWEPLTVREDLPFQTLVDEDPSTIAEPCNAACPDLDGWLDAHPNVAAAIRWQDATGPLEAVVRPEDERAWADWSEPEKDELREAFCDGWAWWHSPGDPLDDLMEDLVDPPVNVSPNQYEVNIAAADARSLYIAYAAHALMVELAGVVPWSLTDYDAERLDVLLASSALVRRSADGTFLVGEEKNEPWQTLEHRWNHGYAVPAPPRYTFRFLAEGGLIGSDREDTIVRLVDWTRHNLSHAGNDSFATWQYYGAPPVSRVIEGTFNEQFGGFGHWTAGCGGTSGFLQSVLRAVNVPVQIARHCHYIPYFPTESRFLTHGDDPYGLSGAGGVRNLGNPSVPTSALLIDEPTFDAWFHPERVNTSYPDPQCDNVGRQPAELVCAFPQVYCDTPPPDCGPYMVPEAEPCPNGFCPYRCWTGQCLPCGEEECELDTDCSLFGRHACSNFIHGDCRTDCEWAEPTALLHTDPCWVDVHHRVGVPAECPATCDEDPLCPEMCPDCPAESARCEGGECVEEWTSCEPFCTCADEPAACIPPDPPVFSALSCAPNFGPFCFADVTDPCGVDCASIVAHLYDPSGAPAGQFSTDACQPASPGLTLTATANGYSATLGGFALPQTGLWRVEWTASDLESPPNDATATHWFFESGNGRRVGVVVDERLGPVTGLEWLDFTNAYGTSPVRLIGPVTLAAPVILDDVFLNAPLVFDHAVVNSPVELRSTSLYSPMIYRNKVISAPQLFEDVSLQAAFNSDDGDIAIPITFREADIRGPMFFSALAGTGSIEFQHVSYTAAAATLSVDHSSIDARVRFKGEISARVEISQSDVLAPLTFQAVDTPISLVHETITEKQHFTGCPPRGNGVGQGPPGCRDD